MCLGEKGVCLVEKSVMKTTKVLALAPVGHHQQQPQPLRWRRYMVVVVTMGMCALLCGQYFATNFMSLEKGVVASAVVVTLKNGTLSTSTGNSQSATDKAASSTSRSRSVEADQSEEKVKTKDSISETETLPTIQLGANGIVSDSVQVSPVELATTTVGQSSPHEVAKTTMEEQTSPREMTKTTTGDQTTVPAIDSSKEEGSSIDAIKTLDEVDETVDEKGRGDRNSTSFGDNENVTEADPAATGLNEPTVEPIVIRWEGWYEVQKIIERFWKGNLFCEEVDRQRQSSNVTLHPILVNISFGCAELFQRSNLGTGNYISLVYAMRMAAHRYENVDFEFSCHDAEETKRELIIPWITGYFPRRHSPSNDFFGNMSADKVCGNYDVVPVAYMYKEIQRDLRKMAIGLVGIPSSNHPSSQFLQDYKRSYEYNMSQSAISSYETTSQTLHLLKLNERPLYSDQHYEKNDAVIHFRCGDLMASNHPSFGFMTFSGYVRHISPEARSVGILTQPFDESTHGRKEDSSYQTRNRCRIAVMSLVDYIKMHHPKANVHIYNDPNETIALTYARMIMANQTIVGISSFGVFPAMGSFGTGYIRKPDYRKAPNKWLLDPPIDQVADNVVLFDEPKRIMAGEIKRLWQSEGEVGVLNWFWDGETKPVPNASIAGTS